MQISALWQWVAKICTGMYRYVQAATLSLSIKKKKKKKKEKKKILALVV